MAHAEVETVCADEEMYSRHDTFYLAAAEKVCNITIILILVNERCAALCTARRYVIVCANTRVRVKLQ
jgi:hypothetical protein